MYPALQRAADRIDDPIERGLFIARQIAADEYDAAIDGALHHAYPAWVADEKYRQAMREYDRASRALVEYRQNQAVR